LATLKTYEDFNQFINEIGFMPLSSNPLGYPNLSALTDPEQWHTGLDTDPWQWKTRIVEEHHAAYGKLFHALPSFITKDWYPLFLAVRRGSRSFDEQFEMGLMSAQAKRIHELFRERSLLAGHEIKRLGGFNGQSKSKFDTAMAALQMGMFITVSGMTRMTTLDGRPHSWPVTEYQRVEDWAWDDTAEQARAIERNEALEIISSRILKIMPDADKHKINKFIGA
jgi:hypothetical protein